MYVMVGFRCEKRVKVTSRAPIGSNQLARLTIGGISYSPPLAIGIGCLAAAVFIKYLDNMYPVLLDQAGPTKHRVGNTSRL